MFTTKKKERLGNMAKIRAPAKILYGLRFKNRCINCGKLIPPDRTMCAECLKNTLQIKIKKLKLQKLRGRL